MRRLEVDDDVLDKLCEFGVSGCTDDNEKYEVVEFLQKNGIFIGLVDGGGGLGFSTSALIDEEEKVKNLFILEKIRRVEDKLD